MYQETVNPVIACVHSKYYLCVEGNKYLMYVPGFVAKLGITCTRFLGTLVAGTFLVKRHHFLQYSISYVGL